MAHPLEMFYPYVPVPGPDLGISLYGLFYRDERFRRRLPKYVEGFRARELYSPRKYVSMSTHVFAKCCAGPSGTSPTIDRLGQGPVSSWATWWSTPYKIWPGYQLHQKKN